MSRNDYKNTSGSRDENAYLSMSYDQLYATLKAQKKSGDEIERIIDRVKVQKEKIEKVVKKFRRKVERKYGMLDEATLVRKGLAHAAKYGLSDVEKNAFIKSVLGGNDALTYEGELKYSKMSRFLGFDSFGTQIINVQAKDQAKLNELVTLFTNTKALYQDIKSQTYTYRSCAPEALLGDYKSDKHVISQHIHPIIAMLFLPKEDAIERRVLQPNIARIVLQRAPLVANKVNLYENVMPGELGAEFELAYSISHDPNSINYFSNESPISNLTNRFRCQVELWKNVLNLRQGKYYASTYGDTNDGISGFLKALSNFDRVYYDGPDNLNANDEGNILKKILGVFSIRPTYTQISSYSRNVAMGYTNISGLSRLTFVRLPVVNIRLPTSVTGVSAPVSLSNALQQTDIFIENKQLVPKHKSVILSTEQCFFFADRKYRTVNFANVTMGFRNIALSPSFIGTTTLNKTLLMFRPTERIGREQFKIRGVIVLQSPAGLDIVTGCSASIVLDADRSRGIGSTRYFSYNPTAAAIKMRSAAGTGFVSNKPITLLPERGGAGRPGFRDTAYARGCIFWYVKD